MSRDYESDEEADRLADKVAERNTRIAELEAEVARLKAKFTKLDRPMLKGDPMLDAVLLERNSEFDAWAATLPETYWARYDLSAARIGWEARQIEVGRLLDRLDAHGIPRI